MMFCAVKYNHLGYLTFPNGSYNKKHMSNYLASAITNRPGALGKQRMIIKGFRTSEARESFLKKNDHGMEGPHWKPVCGDAKPGTYAMVGGEWRNVKSLDRSLLAHI